MKKKAAISFLTWIWILLVLTVLIICQAGPCILIAAVLWFVLPILSWGLNIYNRSHIHVSVKSPAMASKHSEIQGIVEVKNDGRLPVGCMYCRISMENRLTQERHSTWIALSSSANGKTEKAFTYSTKYCGYIVIKIEELYLMDWFGFMPTTMKAEAVCKCSVIPDTFSMDVLLNVATAQSIDSDSWSQVMKGNDYSEVFAIREYVPGDSLKQIHWKLSSKLNELLVKEPSLPTQKSLLLFWDKYTAQGSPKEMDAMAEVVASVAQSLSDQGISYKLGWTEGNSVVLEDVESENQLIPLIPRMIKSGNTKKEVLVSNIYEQQSQETFGKVIYFAKELPEETDQFHFTELVFVLCGMAQDNQWYTVNYLPETYAEDMQKIEL